MTDTRLSRVVLLCGPPGVFTITERACWACKAIGRHASQWLGFGYGHDHHCLTCRVTDRDGFIEQPTPGMVAHWDEVVEFSVVPSDLFERYVETDLFFYGPKNLTIEDEERWDEEMVAITAEIRAHKEQARAAIAATEETP